MPEDVSWKPDVSPRALSIARMIDRLGPGRHRIEIAIEDFPGSPWELSVAELTVVTKVTKTMVVVAGIDTRV